MNFWTYSFINIAFFQNTTDDDDFNHGHARSWNESSNSLATNSILHVPTKNEPTTRVLRQLEHVLNNENNADNVYFSELSACHETDLPLTVRISKVNLRFFKLINSAESKRIEQLQATYINMSKEIENDRQKELSKFNAHSNRWLGIHSLYDNRHHRLIDDTERSLLLLEREIAQGNAKKENCFIQSASPSYLTFKDKLASCNRLFQSSARKHRKHCLLVQSSKVAGIPERQASIMSKQIKAISVSQPDDMFWYNANSVRH